MKSVIVLLILVTAAACSAREPAEAVRFLDAHSHFVLPGLSPDDEIALFRSAGVAGVVIMHPDPEVLLSVAGRNSGYVIPFISIARLPDMQGLRLGADTAGILEDLHDAGSVCGFGEIPTRIQPPTEASDALALQNPFREAIYELAAVRGVPVNMHVDLNSPELIEAVGAIAASHRGMPMILAHAGWGAGPDIIEGLLAAHPNIYTDLSIRLDPRNGWGDPPVPRPDGPNTLSVLDEAGALQGAWRDLMERYPDRFLFAMDITGSGGGGREQRIGELLALATKAFEGLSEATRAAVAHGNLERLLADCPSLRGG